MTDTRQGYPLSLSFDSSALVHAIPSMGRNLKDLRRLLVLISPHFFRLERLDIAIERSESEVSALQDDVPLSLFQYGRKLNLRLDIAPTHRIPTELARNGSYLQRLSTIVDKFGLCHNTQIRELTLGGDWGARYRPLTQVIPGAQLEILTIQSTVTILKCAQLLQACPNLVDFKASFSGFSPLPHTLPPSFATKTTMKALEHVSLGLPDLQGTSFANELISSFDLPSLKYLRLYNQGSQSARMELLSTIIATSGGSVVSLHLDNCGLSQDAFADLLSLLPNLIQLNVSLNGWEDLAYDNPENPNDTLIDRLTPQPDGGPKLCPALQYLKCNSNTIFPDESFAHFLLQRAPPLHSRTRMKQVDIGFARLRNYNIIPDCSDLISAGLDLRIVYESQTYAPYDLYQRPDPWTGILKENLRVEEDYRVLGWE